MTDSGLDGGGGLSPAKKSPAPVTIPARLTEKSESVVFGVDLFTQAFKALSERSPFDSAEVLANTSPTLPSVLANLLLKNSDSRKKHKRQHGDTKSSRKSSEKSKKLNIWVELEDYFRELTLVDIDRLSRLSSSCCVADGIDSCLTIPNLGNFIRIYDDSSIVKLENNYVDNAVTIEDVTIRNVANVENGHVANDRVLEVEVVEVKEEEEAVKGSDKSVVSLDDDSRDSSSVVKSGSMPLSSTQSCSSIEWVLGSRNRVLLTTTRPTKKRKLLGENAGLERLMVAHPCEGSSTLCHVCSIGDTGDQLNRLAVCKLCNVVVHQKCYGVQGEVTESWMCSLCKYKSDHGSSSDRPCVLCPKSGGASKKFQRAGSEAGVEFAHLFCCQWMPEVHISDTRTMEPLLCAEGIKDVRAKLVCNLCKIKLGSCVRCSDGSCRIALHPICAREARNKLEIWGKFGCDDIELRAFCGRHSGKVSASGAGSGTPEKKNLSDAVGDSLAISVQPGNKIRKLKIGSKNGDRVASVIGVANANTICSGEHVSKEVIPNDIKSNTELNSGSGDIQGLRETKPSGRKSFQDKTPYFDLGVVLKKLLDRGKVTLEQIASEFSITEDSLETKLAGNHLGPEMSCKILKWLTDQAYMDTSEKDPRAKIRRLLPPKPELVNDDQSDAVAIIDLDMPDVVPVKSVPPRRRTVGNFVKEEKVMPLCNDKLLGNGVSMKEGTVPEQEQVSGDHNHSSKDAISEGMEKNVVEIIGSKHSLEEPSPASESFFLKSISPCDMGSNTLVGATLLERSFPLDLDHELPPRSISTDGLIDAGLESGADSSFVHPCIFMEEVQCLLVKKAPPECGGWTEIESSTIGQSPTVNGNVDEGAQSKEVSLENLRMAKEMGILDLSPENEVEGEIIFSQQSLLRNSIALKRRSDQLVCNVVGSLSDELNAVRKKRWDDVMVNQYSYELKEARKQSRKERRHKEAQAAVAAATAAVAASTRNSSLRKDVGDESSQQETPLTVESSRIRGGSTLLPVPRPKDFNSSFDVPKGTLDAYPNMFQYNSGSPKENLKTCDICKRIESLLNPILVCLSCKVAVHLSCYRSVKESTGPWYCELCEDLSSSKASRITLEKPYPIAECGLCGASNGAFRKSSNGQWIHAICAEWVFDSTFRRGQVSPVAGMETVVKGNDVCSVCHRRFGVCIKCNYGNCQITFHPSCARSAGYYMHTKYVGGGKMQHKAYCCKHSVEQKVKGETQKHGAEDLKIVKQHRVELEKLRLLCERIVKREKLKRELIICNYDILASRRDSVPLSMVVRRPFLLHDGSSESASTSLKGYSRSCSEAMQKSDDVTADSALSSQRATTPKTTERAPFAGKQLPVRAALSRRNFSDSGEKTRKNNETLGKEMLMTSDQASSRNSRLPKGYFYVPIDTLPNEKPIEKEDDG